MRGDIKDPAYWRRTQEYIWSTIGEGFPRGIMPTNIDGFVEMGNKFFVFEGKTEGAKIPQGQANALKRLLMSWPCGWGVLVLGTHEPVERVDAAQMKQVQFAWREGDEIRWSPRMQEPSALYHVAKFFSRDAAAGCLRPQSWFHEWTELGRPF